SLLSFTSPSTSYLYTLSLHVALPIFPPSSPKITRPLAVVSVPPHELAGPGSGSVQAMSPVKIFIAFRIRCGAGSGVVRCDPPKRSEEHTSELQSRFDLVCRLLLEKKK